MFNSRFAYKAVDHRVNRRTPIPAIDETNRLRVAMKLVYLQRQRDSQRLRIKAPEGKLNDAQDFAGTAAMGGSRQSRDDGRKLGKALRATMAAANR